jgi:hypothetical protein
MEEDSVDFLEHLNPLRHVTTGRYLDIWQSLFSTLLQGFWGRLFAVSFLLLSFWFGVRRRNFAMGAAFFALSLTFTYGAQFLRVLGLL